MPSRDVLRQALELTQDEALEAIEDLERLRLENPKLVKRNKRLEHENQLQRKQIVHLCREKKRFLSTNKQLTRSIKEEFDILRGELRSANEALQRSREKNKELNEKIMDLTLANPEILLEEDGRKVKVSNIPPDGSIDFLTDKLMKTFLKFGEIIEHYVIPVNRNNPEKSRFYGFVTFRERDSADQAITAGNRRELGPLRVDRAKKQLNARDNNDWLGKNFSINDRKRRPTTFEHISPQTHRF